jgi:hypothetical protein
MQFGWVRRCFRSKIDKKVPKMKEKTGIFWEIALRALAYVIDFKILMSKAGAALTVLGIQGG